METRGAAMSFTAAAAAASGFVVFLLCMPAVQGTIPTITVIPSGEIVEGDKVTLTCHRDRPQGSVYTWYKMLEGSTSDQDAIYSGRGPKLVFESIKASQYGVFYCKAEVPGKPIKKKSDFLFINVKYPPKLTSVSVRPSGDVDEGTFVNMTCTSVANPAASYTWYKGSDKKPASKGPHFIFSSVHSSDSGQYYCKAENHLGAMRSPTSIFLYVKHAPRIPSVSEIPSEIVEGSSVNLTCGTEAFPPASYNWFKKNENKPVSEGTQLYFSSIQSSNSGEYRCIAKNQLGMRGTEFIFIDVKYPPKIPSVSVSLSGEIVEGSSVTLTCSGDANPAANYTWYKKNENKPESEGPQLIFSSIQSSNSGEYHCEAENNLGRKRSTSSISIDVKYAPRIPSVSVSPSGEIVEGSSVTLTCSSDANPAASHTWYKKNENKPLSEGPQLVFSSIQSSNSGEYVCEAKNHVGTKRSEFSSIDVKYAPRLPSVSVSLSGEIVEGSSVTLTCSSDANPAANYTWYKKNENKPLSEGPRFIFSSIQSSNSGEYVCEAENHLGRKRSTSSISIDVKYAPRIPSVSVSPSGEIVEGSSVTLTCSSDANPAANYTWYKKKENKPLSEGPQLVFSSIQSSKSGEYVCEAKNHVGKKRSEFSSIDVKYAPRLPSVSVNPSGEIVEGSSVTLTCSSDANPAASYTWYKKNENKPLSEGPQLVFRSIQSTNSGEYVCEAKNHVGTKRSEFSSIDVKYPPRLPSVSVSPSGEIVEGSSVTLTCSSDANPAASYTWYKKNEKKHVSEGPQFIFSSIQSSNSGEYVCEAKNHLGRKRSTSSISIDVKYAPRLPSVSVSPSGKIVEGSSVTLTCRSDANPAANYTWNKKNENKPLNKGPRLVFSSIQSSNSGEYVCEAKNHLGMKGSEFSSIDVKYAPRLPSVSVSPSGEIVEGSSVTLTCSSDANPAASYTWYKEKKPLPQGPKGVYGFTSISSEDRRNYYCKSENPHGSIDSTSLFLNVQYAPKIPSVSVSPSRKIVEGNSVTLTCSGDANPAASYTWYKKNENKPLSKGPQLIFSSIQPSDSGEYVCEAENKLGTKRSKFINIDVKYAPRLPSVSVSPSGEIVEGSSVTLTCSSDANPAARYTWYKGNQPVLQGPKGVYGFTPISSEDRGNYYCNSKNPHGSIDSTSLFLNVQYAPKIPSVSVSPFRIADGSTVNLTCSSDANPAANYSWYKENEDSPKASGHLFTIIDFRNKHTGNYYCEAQNTRGRSNSTLYHITMSGSLTEIILWSAVGLAIAVFLALMFLDIFLLIRKRLSDENNQPAETPNNNTQENHLYCMIGQALPQRPNEEAEVVHTRQL
ncbi:basement membrane-specific heparan sulfate proteoglycan core protein-like isoform X2 [Clinocottus analis]|uniref:basement membrane-specific heparan sulfate proteoglycan core protein-like isoform X2 n=1 Tax=Clinocottus analis TaxID=304258 RepID=UPI0035BEEC29